jgi:hypothetical protein
MWIGWVIAPVIRSRAPGVCATSVFVVSGAFV